MNAETFTYAVFALLFGLAIGSFLNVVIIRGLSGESIAYPPSKCPKCSKKLSWYTNIPVVSYIFLSGKCQFCKQPISIQYPLVEALNGILYVILFLTFGLTLKTLFLCALISIFILLAMTDLRENVIFDLHAYIMIALGLLYNILRLGYATVFESILGIMAGFLVFEIMAKFGTIIAGARAFEFGDTLIAMGLGAFFGWKQLLVIIFLSLILQALLALPMLFIKHIKNKDYIGALAYLLIIVCFFALRIFGQNFNYTLIMCAVLMGCLIVILKGIRSQKGGENLYRMPFGPSLVLSALMMLFFSKEILSFFIF